MYDKQKNLAALSFEDANHRSNRYVISQFAVQLCSQVYGICSASDCILSLRLKAAYTVLQLVHAGRATATTRPRSRAELVTQIINEDHSL